MNFTKFLSTTIEHLLDTKTTYGYFRSVLMLNFSRFFLLAFLLSEERYTKVNHENRTRN